MRRMATFSPNTLISATDQCCHHGGSRAFGSNGHARGLVGQRRGARVPALDERYVGYAGVRDLRASRCQQLADARLSTTDPYLFQGAEAEGFERLRRTARVTRYGLDAYAYARLAAGSIDLVAESGLNPHDYHALIPVVRAAGGVIGNWRGEDDFSDGQVLAAATPALFEEAVGLFSA